ncbi:Alpha/Beta hydrolase protein [Tricladium varicosporioides]|nr:Alpha/Beta hydrolase protein [Hymenoscyphus varicosporioides]
MERQHSLKHSELGTLLGQPSETGKSTQYRGIKFAIVPSRWSDPILNTQPLSSDTPYDATKYGPSCPQHPAGFSYDLSLVGDVVLEKKEVETDEFDCLNLVITVPGSIQWKGLPVMVWVHGGGFSVGANSWLQYDLTNLVETSLEIGKPVVGVSINYRLGIFGFAASSQLGISGNYGLKDQEMAFHWVQQYIAGFGGNPYNITAFGESAGSICVSTLLHTSSSRLFDRAILMSGDPTLRRPRSFAWQDQHLSSLIGKTHLSYPNISELRGVSSEVLVNSLPSFSHWSPTIDGQYMKDEITIGTLKDRKDERGKPIWCKEVLVGDALHDGTCLHGRLLSLPHQELLARVHYSLSSLTTEERLRVLGAYNLENKPHPKQIYNSVLEMATDLRFYFGTLALAEGFGNRARRYHIHHPNPIEGLYRGYASHELEVALMLGNFDRFFPEKSKIIGRNLAEIVIGFANGDGLGDMSPANDVLMFGDEMWYELNDRYDKDFRGGRAAIWEEIGWERWFKIGELLQGC